MGRQCAWCKCNLGVEPLVGHISHGICDACFAHMMQPIHRERIGENECKKEIMVIA
jgi:hypothetical protein